MKQENRSRKEPSPQYTWGQKRYPRRSGCSRVINQRDSFILWVIIDRLHSRYNLLVISMFATIEVIILRHKIEWRNTSSWSHWTSSVMVVIFHLQDIIRVSLVCKRKLDSYLSSVCFMIKSSHCRRFENDSPQFLGLLCRENFFFFLDTKKERLKNKSTHSSIRRQKAIN